MIKVNLNQSINRKIVVVINNHRKLNESKGKKFANEKKTFESSNVSFIHKCCVSIDIKNRFFFTIFFSLKFLMDFFLIFFGTN